MRFRIDDARRLSLWTLLKERAVYLLFVTVILFGLIPAVIAPKPVEAARGDDPYYLTVAGLFRTKALLKMETIVFKDVSNNDTLTDKAKEYDVATLNAYLTNQVLGDYIDQDIGDSTNEYIHNKGGCESKIKQQEGHWKLIQLKADIPGQGCIDILRSSKDPTLPYKNDLANEGGSVYDTSSSDNVGGHIRAVKYTDVWFERTNSNTLKRVDGWGGNWVEEDPENQPGRYFSADKGDDGYYVQLMDPIAGSYWSGKSSYTEGSYYENNSVKTTVTIKSDEAAEEAPGTETETSDGTTVQGDCDSLIPSGWVNKLNPAKWLKGAIDWFGCTVIKGVLGFANELNTLVDGFLETESDQYNNSSTRQVWGRFLTIANILFVIAFLMMILSTALGFGFVDAYTAKKFLPRIILAVILANLSFAIVEAAIQITNAMGSAVQAMILGPVGGTEFLTDVNNAIANGSASGIVGAGVGIAAGIGISSLATGGIFAIIPAALMLLFAIITAWAVITIRRVIILLLIVVAPFAIAMWAIPGLENWAKRWWKLFIEMLLIYPIVKAIISAGMFTAAIRYKTTMASNGEINMMDGLTMLGAVILPFLLLPTVFKIASSTLGNITGMINNRGKGVFDRLSNKSRERAKTTARAQKKHTNAELRQQSRQYKGHHKAIEGVTSKRTGRFAGARNAWNTRGVNEQVLNAARAKQSQEELQQAVYASKANAGGIDAKRRDGRGKHFRVTYTDNAGNKRTTWVGKDAAVAYGWKGATVEAMKEEYDARGNFKGYGKEVEGTLFDGSEAAQRAAGQIAGSQALTPVIDAVRNGSTKDWEEFNEFGTQIGMVNMTSYSDDYSAAVALGDSSAQTRAETANVVRTEVKDGFAQQLSSKMPSFVKGNALAFQSVTAETLSNFHENEVERMMDYVITELPASGKVVEEQETWSRIGQSVKQIVENPEQHTISPKALATLKERYDDYLARGGTVKDATLDKYMGAVNANGTLDRATTPKRAL